MTEAEARQETAAAAEAPAPRAEEPVGVEPAPVADTPRVETPRLEALRVEAPRVDVQELLSGAGLQMVETNASKIRQPESEAEEVKLGRPRRERPAAPAAAEETLVQVETRK